MAQMLPLLWIPNCSPGAGCAEEVKSFCLAGRAYQPGDAATDSIYGSALANPIELDDGKKAIAAAAVSARHSWHRLLLC